MNQINHFKYALITGASAGIGKALAYKLANEGYSLILMARRIELLEKIQQELLESHPNIQVFIQASDVANFDQHEQDIKIALSNIPYLNLAIANAGIGFNTDARKPYWKEIKNTFDVNLLGAIKTLETCKELFIKQGFGQLVGISSVAGTRGLPLSSAYSASKAGFSTYLESIRIDLAKKNISVTAIHPGFIDTPMTKENGKMPWLMPADKAANSIFNAIQKKKSRLYFPWQMALLMWVLRIMPHACYDKIMHWNFKKAEVFKKDR